MMALAIITTVAARALSTDAFTQSSALSSGRWVRVEVKETGMHLISTSDLRAMGFSDPSRVGVFGYGGARISDVLTADRVIDDLPRVASVVTPRGVAFFASGPETWRPTPGRNAGPWMERVINPYTESCYYYLTEVDTKPELVKEGVAGGDSPVTQFIERLWHEKDMVSIHETGHDLYGEDFRFTTAREFVFTLTDRVESTEVWMSARFAAMCPSSTSTVSYTVNGTQLACDQNDMIRKTSGSYNYADTCLSRKTFSMSGNKLTLGVSFKTGGTVRLAHLDRIDINYWRQLKLPSTGTLLFSTTDSSLQLGGTGDGSGLHVWDVTNPLDIKEMNLSIQGGKATWTGEYTGSRTYMAWREDATMNTPGRGVEVANQDLHSQPVPDMIIVTIKALRAQAERIADLHRNHADSLSVLVVTADEVYNEFSSGMPDPGAFRRMAKMFYDRGMQSLDSKKLKYLMLMGRPTYDHRRKTPGVAGSTAEILPVWQTDSSISDNTSYSSDDIIGMLADGSGVNLGTATIDIAIGRVPVTGVAETSVYVDKLAKYINNPPFGDWQNKVLIIADDQDSGEHMKQAELMEEQLLGYADGNRLKLEKIYIDAYPKINGKVPAARDKMMRAIDNGVFWMHYIGHASHNSWSHEHLLVSTDVSSLYTRNLPVIFAATCDFGRWDSAETCGAEAMLLTDGGGTIAICTPTRPVYISQNRYMTVNAGATMMRRHPDGRPFTVGDVVRHTKNYTYTNRTGAPSNDTNRLRYVLFGDPALPMVVPSCKVLIESVNGVNVESADPDAEPATVMARQEATVTGRIVDHNGKLIEDFDGLLALTLYDAEYSTTSSGRGTDDNPGEAVTFEQIGDMLFTGRAKVEKGRFETKISMPSDVSQNYRPAALSVVAASNDGSVRAAGLTREVYVYGYDETAVADTIAPVIDSIYLNHSTFHQGDAVNSSPVLLAEVSDNIGINLSTAGVGHQMTLRLDGNKSFNDVSQYYIPATDGSPQGTITYPLEGLSDGAHQLTLTVWDTANNPCQATIDFFVDGQVMPKMFDVFTDTNPASTEARFYISHNRPDALLTVTIEVFNLNGQPVWTSAPTTGRADMFTTAPVTWNLTDATGRRVNRGIYLYRASLSADGGVTSVSSSRRLAVTAR